METCINYQLKPIIVGAYNNTYANFGNSYFGTTAVSSAGTNASNNGIFEYDVPTGLPRYQLGIKRIMAYTT